MSADEISKQKNEMVKNGFIQAAKELILREGVESVSVRKIAQATGYSYATIYHYFSDLDALLLEVKERMVEDVATYFISADASPYHSVSDLQRANRAYVQYYLDRPHIYHFFYCYRFENNPAPNYDLKFQESWFFVYAEFVENGLLQKEDIPIVAKMIIYTIQGLLALYFSSNGLTEEQLHQDLNDIAEYVFNTRRRQ